MDRSTNCRNGKKFAKIPMAKSGKIIVVVRRFPDILPCVWFKIQDVFEDDINVFHKETTTNEEEELPDLKKLWKENFQEESFIH